MLYYGDEIGMGDNIWLGDRDGVRTPMQWTPDRNAGFSVATPGRLHLPPIQDPVFGYQRVNVETELENASSLLHWTRRMIHARKKHPAFGLGDFTDLGGSNPSVLSYVREHVAEDGTTDTVLCVNNLSRFPQPVELDLRRFEGVAPIELLGGVRFPEIGELPYLLTLGAYGFYWFRLPDPARRLAAPTEGGARVNDRRRRRRCTTTSRPPAGSAARAATSPSSAYAGSACSATPTRLARSSASSWSPWSTPATEPHEPRPTRCRSRYYAEPQERLEHARVGTWDATPTCGTVHAYDAVHDREATALWLRGVRRRRRRATVEHGDLTFHRLPGHDLDLDAHSTLFSGEQSNSSVAFGEDALMKVFRKVTPGRNPDIVIHKALTEPEQRPRRGALRLARAAEATEPTSRSSSRCCSSSCAPPATAGTSRWPACATCSPRPTCTPTRWAATSPARPSGSGWRPRRCTTCSPSSSRPRRGDPTTSPRCPTRC